MMLEPVYGNIPLDCVIADPKQPRKHFDQASLNELADSIRAHGVVEPIIARPVPQENEGDRPLVMIVDGERRWRASQIACVETIPTIVRDLSDADVLEIQLIANLQRADVHPIEEAEGYERLMKENKLTVDQVVAKMGKSRSYIYARLKYCALAPDCRTMFFEGKLSPSTALLIARIPIASLQVKAAEEIIHGHGGETMSYRSAMAYVRNRYMLDLSDAPFSITDIALVPDAGACGTCPKRTGNDSDLFADVGSADVCTDPDCFASKRAAHHAITLRAAEENGTPIFDSQAEAKNAEHSVPLMTGDAHLWPIARLQSGLGYQSLEKVLTPEQRPEPAAYIKEANGNVIVMYAKTAIEEALEAAGLRTTIAQHNAAMEEKLESSERAVSPDDAARLERRLAMQRQAEFETRLRVAIYMRMRDFVGAEGGLPTRMLRIVVKALLKQHSLPTDDLAACYTYGVTAAGIDELVDEAEAQELEQLIMDIVVRDEFYVDTVDIEFQDEDDEPTGQTLMDLAANCAIDVEAIRIELAPAPVPDDTVAVESSDDVPAPATKAAKKSKKKTSAVTVEADSDTAAVVDTSELAADDDGVGVGPSDPAADLAVGDRVRINDDLYGPTGKRRVCCGRRGAIVAFDGTRYSVKTGSKKADLINDLMWNEITRLQPIDNHDDAAAEPIAEKIDPSTAAWPFPKGSGK